MGGGDLNLKKSWHPSTMKNMERVWKAEQQDHQEKKRIAELQKEIAVERDKEEMKAFAMEHGAIERKDDKKLDWMYKGPHENVNREDYLLGRPIDKQFEQIVKSEKASQGADTAKNHVEHECIPPSLRFFSGNDQVDLARKLQEDPLYAIKKKEMETRSQLLKNPVKMKQLKQMVAQNDCSDSESDSSSSDESPKRKTKTFKGGDEKTHKQSEIDHNSKNSGWDKSWEEYSGKKKKHCEREDEYRHSKSEAKNRSPENHHDKRSKKRREHQRRTSKSQNHYNEHKEKKSRSRTGHSEHSRERSEEEEEIQKHHRKSHRSEGQSQQRREEKRKNRKRENSETRNTSMEEEEGRQPHQSRNFGLMKADGSKISPPRKRSLSRENCRVKTEPVKKEPKWVPPKKHKLSDEEKERRRKEMMMDASHRDEERRKNVKRYEEEEKRESMKEKSFDKSFLQKHLAMAANTETLTSRIKSNINNIQRTNRSMDSNFAKR
ncbi:hypothetical protein QAD02_015562 [Eretmocerus hayati]|uniref:Uncharacterized protein n=1 Tax=Eretmocerus hayati TaxID=131215 RepID=A0ACC2P8N8_9HYME|nr:hypothetical protein QAD02_015562 [Eretmocerus hayati]